MPDIDLYTAHGLDRNQPPETLAAQLGQQLATTNPRDSLSRNRIETAQAILGDPHRRARYDALLSDQNAPPITERVLAAIANSGSTNAVRTRSKRVLGSAAAGLAALLVGALVAVSCSGTDGVSAGSGHDNDSPASSPAGSADNAAGSSGGSSVAPEPDYPPILDDPYPDEQRLRIGDEVVVDNHFLYHLTGLTRVTDPSPECPGTYYVLDATVKSIDDWRGTASSLRIVTGDAQGNLSSDDRPVGCRGATASFDVRGPAAPITSYASVSGLVDPVVVYILDHTGFSVSAGRFVVIPEDLR